MKQLNLTLAFTMLLSMIAIEAYADFDRSKPIKVGSLYYYIDNDNKTAEVTSMPNHERYSGEINIPSYFEYNNLSYNVTGIGNGAFTGCEYLISISIGNNVKSIEECAFSHCSGLSSITIPNSVTSIGNDAFNGCLGLTSITIGNGVTSIGNFAFYGCSKLISVEVKREMPISIEQFVFSNRENTTLYVPIGSKTAYSSAYWWRDFKEIVEMGTEANFDTSAKIQVGPLYYYLDNDNNVAEVTSNSSRQKYTGDIEIPSYLDYNNKRYNVTSIGEYAFNGSASLSSVTIPNSVTSIGIFAFNNCSSLTSIFIPRNVRRIGYGALNNCEGLELISVESDNIYYDSHENCNAIIRRSDNTLISGCKNTIIPNNVTRISEYAFSGCSGLTSINIPNSITSIGEYAFETCYSLTSINIPSGVTNIGERTFYCSGITSLNIPISVTSIGNEAFSGCSFLTSVTIPNNVTSIGSHAFFGCNSLTSVSINRETPISITEYVFTNRANATLYVPIGSKVAYKTADYWKDFKEIVETNNFETRINQITDDNSIVTDLYTIDGKRIDYRQKGLNIIRTKDGKTRKFITN